MIRNIKMPNFSQLIGGKYGEHHSRISQCFVFFSQVKIKLFGFNEEQENFECTSSKRNAFQSPKRAL